MILSLSSMPYIYLCKILGLLHHQGNVASSHWFFSIVLSSHQSTCQFLGGSIKNIHNSRGLRQKLHSGLKIEQGQRPWPKHHSGVACFHAQPCRSRGLQRPWRLILLGHCVPTQQTTCEVDTGNARGPTSLGCWLRQLLSNCPAIGSNARGPYSTRPLGSSASYFQIRVITTLPLLKRNFVPEIYLFMQWRITEDTVIS